MSDTLKNRLSLIRDKVNRSHLDNHSGQPTPTKLKQPLLLQPKLTPAPSAKDLEARSFIRSLKRDQTERKKRTENLLLALHQRNEEASDFDQRMQRLRQHAE